MSPTIALAIPHTPWRPERVASYERLTASLGVRNTKVPGFVVAFEPFTDRAPNHVWSEKLWTWLAETEATHCLVLQDDVEVAPNFWAALGAMCAALPDQVIGLAAVLPQVRLYAEEGTDSWVTTAEHVIGWAYCLPRTVLCDLLAFRRDRLKDGAVEALHEDDIIDCFCLATGRRVWHPIPTIVQHDTTLESSYGNDDHANRRAVVTWREHPQGADLRDLEDVYRWTPGEETPHLGLGYPAGNIVKACARWVKGFGEPEIRRAMSDSGMAERRRLTYLRRSRRGFANGKRIFIATPDRGAIHPAHEASVMRMLSSCDANFVEGRELISVRTRPRDVVYARSLFVRDALESDCTHLFFFDADVACAPSALEGMIRSEHGIVLTPYLRRDENSHRPMIGAIRQELGPFDAHGCTEVRWGPIGSCLIERSALERMVEYYRAELRFDDVEEDGTRRETVALFLIGITPERRLLSEDEAFFARARAMGLKVHAYFGPGSPADHYGDHCYRGDLEVFGIRREPA